MFVVFVSPLFTINAGHLAMQKIDIVCKIKHHLMDADNNTFRIIVAVIDIVYQSSFSDISVFSSCLQNSPDSKVHGANVVPTWDLSAPDGPHADPRNLAIRVIKCMVCICGYMAQKAPTRDNRLYLNKNDKNQFRYYSQGVLPGLITFIC